MGGDARTLGGYRLLSQLAVGGMAEIYIAKTNGVGGFEKLVALKVIHPNFSQDPEFVQMLVDEAKLTVQLQHANIVQTFDLGRVDDQYYIAMELVDGIDLYRLLRQSSERDIDFPFEIAAFIAGEACNGLDYAHRKRDPKGRPLQIVHRDISPQNLLVSYDGEVKIVDFGIAKAALRGRQTAAGVIKGKYYYMSPEQAWGDPIDARTDVFSTGILLYEMLVGQMLYLEEDLEVLLDKVRKAVIPLPSTKRSGIPPELEQIVMKALKKRPADRYQSAGEMAAALSQFLHTAAPDFNRGKLASFAQDVLGAAFDDPTTQSRDPRASTALNREMLAKDEHSLLFQLSDLKPPESAKAKAAPKSLPKPLPAKSDPPKPAPAPRARDQATSPVSLPEVARRIEAGHFEESDQTIVDGGSATLMAHLPGDSEPQALSDDPAQDRLALPHADRRGPGAGALALPHADRRGPGAGAFDLGDDLSEDATTLSGSATAEVARGARQAEPRGFPDTDERPLPGVRPALQPPTLPRKPPPPPGKPPSRPLPSKRPTAPDSPSLAGDDEDERTRQHQKPAQPPAPMAQRPTVEMRKAQRPEPPQNGAPSMDSAPTPIHQQVPPDLPPMSSFDEATRVPPEAPRPSPSPGGARKGEPGAKPLNTLAGDAWPFHPIGSPNDDPTVTPPTTPSGQWTPEAARGFRGGSQENSSTALVHKPGRTLIIVGVAAAVLLTAIGIGLAVSGTGPARASIEVVSLPPGADVHLDGNPVPGRTPLTLPNVDALTSHHVRVSLRNYDVWESDVKFEQGAREVRLPAVLVPTVGTLVLTSTPAGAEAIVNGRIRGITPVTVGDLPPNDDVTIELRLRGYKVAHKSAAWEKHRRLEVSIPLEKAK